MRVLVVEDDEDLRSAIYLALRASGLGVDTAADLPQARLHLGDHGYDCVILDRTLPGGDGLALLDEREAATAPVPILVLTARDAIRDRLRGFESGADDYLVKPFAMAELIARVRALCRRRGVVTSPVLRAGDIEVDTARREVRRAGVLLALTPKEYCVIELLSTRAGGVTPRDALIEHCWDELTEPMSNAPEVLISQLRRKLGDPSPIRTVRGAGYLLER